jgi:hypothetical protein
MNKKLLGAVLALAVIIAVAAVAPTLAHNPSTPPAPGTEYVYVRPAATVVLNLPTGGICNKTNIRFSVMDTSAHSTKGAEDYLDVRVWVPSKNSFIAVAIIDDNPVAVDSLKKMLKGIPNVQPILVADSDLEVWSEGNTFIANLTRSVDIKIGDPAPQVYKDLNFTLPPLTLKFVKTGEVFEKTESTTSYPSGWKNTVTQWNAPAWAGVTIPAWTGSIVIPTTGVLHVKMNMVATPPPAP